MNTIDYFYLELHSYMLRYRAWAHSAIPFMSIYTKAWIHMGATLAVAGCIGILRGSSVLILIISHVYLIRPHSHSVEINCASFYYLNLYFSATLCILQRVKRCYLREKH